MAVGDTCTATCDDGYHLTAPTMKKIYEGEPVKYGDKLVLREAVDSEGLVPGDVVLSVNGISGLSNFQVVEMLRKGHGVFNLVVISGRQVQQQLNAAQQPQG